MYQENSFISMDNWGLAREIGKFIRHHRIRQEKTQEELATHAGIKRNTLFRIEKGDSFNIMTLLQLLRSLNMLDSVMYVFKVKHHFSPSQVMKLQGKIPKRVRHKKNHKMLGY